MIEDKKNELYEDIYKNKFSFGKNWQDFLTKLNNEKIENAKKYLITFMGGEKNIIGKTVIDFGSGSGLMSLCFYLLGAKQVISIDIDENSIYCTNKLKDKYYKIGNGEWNIEKGSVLDKKFIDGLGTFDIVYSRGVIHHSGNMWKGLENIINLISDHGLLYIAIYNNSNVLLEGTSKFWKKIKKIYSGNRFLRPFIKAIYTLYLIFGLTIKGKNIFKYIKNYKKEAFRGMDFFIDIEDRLGGYPYEYASFEEIKQFYENKGFKLKNSNKVRSIGCNEFLFSKI